ncbi:MAG: butyrate kinase [Erysipelotrichaceae bacterium]|nr:butyrate kinase [Erysipelotrichaceae bacterium]
MKLLIINPGSTSTKLSIYEDEEKLAEASYFHDAPELLKYPHVNAQIPFRKRVIDTFAEENRFKLEDVDVFVGRGGSAYPCKSGVMEIDDQLYEDTKDAVGGSEHPAKLGVMLAHELAKEYGKKAYTMDPTNVDELIDEARITGIKGVYRNAQAHVLNQKAVARKHCALHGLDYEHCDLIVAHIDGGITVNAHHNGKMIDGNVGSGGDGAFTPTRIGSVPVLPLLDYIDDHGTKKVRDMCSRSGGFVSYFGTSDFKKIYERVKDKDGEASLVYSSMVYQIGKQIGAMAVVLKGHVDAILLTGGLMIYEDIFERIKESCSWIAEVYSYPGELEQEALAGEVCKALKGEREILKYQGKPVFEGFSFIEDEKRR